jgi:broad specificity phosphatase PhoE
VEGCAQERPSSPATEEALLSLSRLLDARGGPLEIVLVRHGESVGNLADAAAQEQGAHRLELAARDADVELSATGEEQADALRAHLAALDGSEVPTLALTSPYRRAADTAERALRGLDVELLHDERLRERDLGVLDGLTKEGIVSAFPDEAERRGRVGKFYYQPPSGESWADVALRVRTLLADLRAACDGGRVWLFTHQAVIMSFRYVLEGLSEQELLEIDRRERIGNVSTTRYRRVEDGFRLVHFADTSILDRGGAHETHEPRRARLDDGAGAADAG